MNRVYDLSRGIYERSATRVAGLTLMMGLSSAALAACSTETHSDNPAESQSTQVVTPNRPDALSKAERKKLKRQATAAQEKRDQYKAIMTNQVAELPTQETKVAYIAQLACKNSETDEFNDGDMHIFLEDLYDAHYDKGLSLPDAYAPNLYTSLEGGNYGTVYNLCPPTSAG